MNYYEMYHKNPKYQRELYDFYEKTYKDLKNGILPKSYPKGPMLQDFYLIYPGFTYKFWRTEYIKSFGFPLFAEDWVKPLAQWIGDRPCLEIMAGTGYFSYALKQYGCNIKATDNYSWSNKFDTVNKFIDVENLDCIEAIRKYGKDVKFIICSWPYMDDYAYRCLITMREVNPKCRMIYIGEDMGGCTANDKFFETMDVCEVQGFLDAVKNYRRWEGIYDFIALVK